MKAAVITFPGSNCDRDGLTAMRALAAQAGMREDQVVPVWHGDASLPKVDVVFIPGGFSYGDYLRCGAMAAHSPIMQDVVAHANRGGYVLGVCNGFQVLTETRLLPGALLRNAGLKFVCKPVNLKVEATDSIFTSNYHHGQVIDIPVAHGEGNYFADDATLAALEAEGRVAFRYVEADGRATPEANPNGSRNNIAGILSENKRVLGMMPHPERHAEALTGGTDGAPLLQGLLAA
jgi:phosphoribosylformylglycinamidine synthase I